MKSYVEMAKKAADDRRAEDAAKREKEKAEGDRNSAQVDKTMKLLKKALRQWGKEGKEQGFSYKDAGTVHYVDCAEIYKNGTKLLGFQCHWDRWEAQYSDDCKTDEEGIAIKVTFSQDTMQEWSSCYSRYCSTIRTETFRYPYDPSGLVERCMESVAQYLSKFF